MTATQSKYVSETIFKRGPTKNAVLVEGVQGGVPSLLGTSCTSELWGAPNISGPPHLRVPVA